MDSTWKMKALPNSNPKKVLNFMVGILHATIIHTGWSVLLETGSIYIAQGDGVYEIAVTTRIGSMAAEDMQFNAPFGTHHSNTWKVKDLGKVDRHLEAMGVRIILQDGNTIVTKPADTIGEPWGFPGRCRCMLHVNQNPVVACPRNDSSAKKAPAG
ncbi:hypothetical protein ACJZ2D_014209 [Fusarium nematophilum]